MKLTRRIEKDKKVIGRSLAGMILGIALCGAGTIKQKYDEKINYGFRENVPEAVQGYEFFRENIIELEEISERVRELGGNHYVNFREDIATLSEKVEREIDMTAKDMEKERGTPEFKLYQQTKMQKEKESGYITNTGLAAFCASFFYFGAGLFLNAFKKIEEKQ